MTDYPADMSVHPDVSAHFDPATNTISYIVKDPASDACAIVDSVMDIDYAAGRITYEHADALIAEVTKRGLTLEWIIETHVHADHLSAAPYIQQKLGGKIGFDTGDTGKATCQVLNLLRLQCAQFGKDTMFDFAVFTIRLSKSVIGVGLAVGLLHGLSLEKHNAILLPCYLAASRAAQRTSTSR